MTKLSRTFRYSDAIITVHSILHSWYLDDNPMSHQHRPPTHTCNPWRHSSSSALVVCTTLSARQQCIADSPSNSRTKGFLTLTGLCTYEHQLRPDSKYCCDRWLKLLFWNKYCYSIRSYENVVVMDSYTTRPIGRSITRVLCRQVLSAIHILKLLWAYTLCLKK